MLAEPRVLVEDRTRVALGRLTFGSPAVRQALVFSLLDGVSATVMLALTETFGIAAAVSLKAPSMAIAILGSAPLFLGSLGQYCLVRRMRSERKPVVLRGVSLQATLLAAAALCGLLPGQRAAWAYVACFVLAGISVNVTAAAWTSWMGDLVPLAIRGRHFAWRSRIFAFINLCCGLSVGLLSAHYKAQDAPWTFFMGVFLCAAGFRFVSLQMLKRQYEPTKRRPASEAPRVTKPSRQFSTFCWANGFVQAAAAMSAPFFIVWYVRDLRFSCLTLAIAGCSTIVGNILSLPLWGRLADHIGGYKTMRIAGLLVCLVPLPYCFSGDFRLVWLTSLFGGIAWAGYNLVSFSQLLNLSEEGSRTSLIAYASVIAGVLVFSMTLLGGSLATRLPVLFEWQLQTLFLLSALIRFAAVGLLPSLGAWKWPRSAEEMFNQIPSYRAGLGLMRNVFRAFRG